MSSALANLEGLQDLLAAGYSLSMVSGHLVVNDVFYVNAAGEQAKGRLAAPLTLVNQTRVGAPLNHQMYWTGTAAHYADRTPIPFAAVPAGLRLGDDSYPWHLSNKPPEGFTNYTDMVTHYVTLIAGPAEQVFGVSPRTHAHYGVPDTSPFKVEDTFSARAQIGELNALLANDHIAIIGLGGTGSFVLDFMVKTPVHAIDAYDFDVFQIHNGFRSPGEVPFDMFGQPKTALYRSKYDGFRHRLTLHNQRITRADGNLFEGVTFAFVCIDDGEARREICAMLSERGVPFIDVGMGIEKENGRLDGLLRTTLLSPETAAKATNELPFDRRDEVGAYRVFVQIAELNALNAALAVIKYKQFRGFYADEAGYFHSLISIASSQWVGLSR